MMTPHFANAHTKQLRGVRFVKVDYDASPQTSAASDIASIPTLILYRGGKEVARQSGAMPTGDLVRWVVVGGGGGVTSIPRQTPTPRASITLTFGGTDFYFLFT